jgi:phage-related protein
MLAIVNSSDEDYAKLTNAINKADGAASDMAQTMSDNLGGDVTLMKSNLESLQLTIYEKFEPSLRKGVDTLNDLIDSVKGVVEWISKNLNVVITTATGLLTAFTAQLVANKVAAIAAAAAEKGLTVAQYAVTTAQAALNAVMAANPIGIVILAITALVAAFMVLWNKSEAFRNFWIGLWDAIKQSASVVIAFLEVAFKTAWDNIKKVWDKVAKYFENVWKAIKTVFSVVKSVLTGDFESAWLGIKAIWSVVSGWFNDNVVKPVQDFFSNMWSNVKKGASDAWNGITETFSHVADWFHEKFSAAWQRVKDVFSTGGQIFDGIKDGITNAFKSVVNAIIRGINRVIAIPFNKINDVLGTLRDFEFLGKRIRKCSYGNMRLSIGDYRNVIIAEDSIKINCKHCDIVKLGSSSHEFINIFFYKLTKGFGFRGFKGIHKIEKSLLTVKLGVVVCCFRNTVCIQIKSVTGRKL